MGRRRAVLVTGVLFRAGLTVGQAETPGKTTGRAAGLTLPASPLSEDERILHALSRLGYGPRPADPARVKAMGLATYVEGQLHPAPAPSPAMREVLANYPVLEATTAQLLRDYPRPAARPVVVSGVSACPTVKPARSSTPVISAARLRLKTPVTSHQTA